MNRRHAHPCGMMLAEMLIIIGLTSVCVVLTAKLTAESYRQMRELPIAEQSMAKSQHFLLTLRQDAWGATSFTPIAGGMRINLPGNKSIDWTVDAAGTVTRTATGAQPRSWAEMAPGLTFQPEAAALLARWPVEKAGVAEIRCVSQILLAGGGR